MDNKSNEIKSKKAYEKPRLRVIELAAEEVMGVGCKTLTSVGPLTLCNVLNCFNTGS